MKVRIIKIISFIMLFIIILYVISFVLSLKRTDGIHTLNRFYKLNNDVVDVLFLGSSHILCQINPAVLYKENGIASFNLASSSQPAWNTYFYFCEALKTQKPKLMIFDVFMFNIETSYVSDAYILRNNYGLKWSINRINSIKISSKRESWNNFFNPFYMYHNRYSSLSMKDFILDNKYKYFKGFLFYGQFTNLSAPSQDILKNDTRRNLLPKTEEYYRKLIELAHNKNIPIIVVVTPYILNKANQENYNTMKDIAEEYNVPFINFNLYYDDYNLDFSKDFRDYSHLNYRGAKKFSKYLGKYLKENYDLPDRRGDPAYYSWEINAKYEYKSIYNFELTNLANLNEYIEKVKNADDYIIAVTMLGNYQSNDAVVQNIYTNLNINDIYLKNASYVLDNNKLIYSSSDSNSYLFYKEIGNYTDLVVDSGRKLSINRKNYIKTKNGINIVIYDKFTEEIVDNIYLEYKDNSIDTTIKR